MTDYLPDSQNMGVAYCPVCEPARDPFEHLEGGRVLEIRYCNIHPNPGSQGLDVGDADETVAASYPGGVPFLSGNTEAGSEQNQQDMCRLLHRPKGDNHEGDDRVAQ